MATIAAAHQKRADFCLEELIRTFRGPWLCSNRDGGNGHEKNESHRHNSTGNRELWGRRSAGWHTECYDPSGRSDFMSFPNAVLLSFVVQIATSGGGHEIEVFNGIEQAQLVREDRMAGYSVTERYTLNNSRFSEPAEMTVAVTYEKGAGKNYRVLSRRGSNFIQNSVFDRLLKEETEMSHGEQRQAALITAANYRMRWMGEEVLEGRNCDVVELEPRKKSPHLLRGKAWVDAATYHLIRIEGKPAASPSFWASSPRIMREYNDIENFSFARRSHAVSQSLLLGRTELNIEYTGYQIRAAEVR